MQQGVDAAALIREFRGEIDDRLRALTAGLLEVEANPGRGAGLDALMREAHTIKGSARMLGLVEVSAVAHRMEDLLTAAGAGELELDAPLVDALLECIDHMAAGIDSAAAGRDDPDVRAGLLAVQRALDERMGRRATAASDTARPVASTGPELAGRDAAVAGVVPAEQTAPDTPPSPPTPAPSPGEGQTAATSAPAQPQGGRPETEDTLRVDVAKLDSLVRITRQLTTRSLRSRNLADGVQRAAARLARLRQTCAAREGGAEADPLRSVLGELDAVAGEVGRLAQGLDGFARALHHDAAGLSRLATDARMVPATAMFEGVNRVVRDLCQTLGKRTRLNVEGEDTRIDKRAVDVLRGPLTHIIRNSLDHGLELPEERLRSGKDAHGQLVMRAGHDGDFAFVEIEDDGAGIDPDDIRAAAVARGLLDEGAAAALSDVEAVHLVFAPGFSTARMVTELSGRGVGLDAVKVAVESLDGRLRVSSTPGRGTLVRLEFPVLLSVARVLIFEIGGARYGVYTVDVQKVVTCTEEEVQRSAGAAALWIDGAAVPLLDRRDLASGQAVDPPSGERPVLILEQLGQRVAVRVDRLDREERVVVGSLCAFLGRLPMVAGTTILGDGEVVVVLKAGGLMRSVAAPQPSQRSESGSSPGRRLLVVDDSLSVRELMRSLLQSHGHEVDVAVDGANGLERARQRAYDAVITDVEMPRMTGYELTAALRKEPGYQRVPIVIVSTRMSAEDKRSGLNAGASAYFEKGAFDQQVFLDTVARLIG